MEITNRIVEIGDDRCRRKAYRTLSDVLESEEFRIGCGDLVVTSGFNGSYPDNIYIGKVKSISGKEYETSLRLELEPFVDFFRLEYVFVLAGEDKDEN